MRRSIFAVRRFAFGVGSWTAILYGLDTQISISNRLNRTSARRVRPRCSRMYSGRWLVPRDFRKGISPSADSRLIRLPALMQCSGVPAPRVLSWGGEQPMHRPPGLRCRCRRQHPGLCHVELRGSRRPGTGFPCQRNVHAGARTGHLVACRGSARNTASPSRPPQRRRGAL